MEKPASIGPGEPALDPEAFARRIISERDRLAPVLPHLSPEELCHILAAMLRPFGTGRRYFLRPTGDGGYVP